MDFKKQNESSETTHIAQESEGLPAVGIILLMIFSLE